MSIVFDIKLRSPVPKTILKHTRPIKEIDTNRFKEDLQKSDLLKSPADDLDTLVKQYNQTLQAILDKNSPQPSRSVKPRKKTHGTAMKFIESLETKSTRK